MFSRIAFTRCIKILVHIVVFNRVDLLCCFAIFDENTIIKNFIVEKTLSVKVCKDKNKIVALTDFVGHDKLV